MPFDGFTHWTSDLEPQHSRPKSRLEKNPEEKWGVLVLSPESPTARRENARVYDKSATAQSVGRYIESDRIGLNGGFNLFSYAGQNPTQRIDRSGLQVDDEGGGTEQGDNDLLGNQAIREDLDEDQESINQAEQQKDEAAKSQMLGANGPTIASKTLYDCPQGHLDVENPNPGQRPGQIHYQPYGEDVTYIYDPVTDSFPGAPNSVDNKLDDPTFRNAINKGLKYLNGQ